MATKSRKSKAVSAGLDFNHAMVYVREVARALRFYGDVLGFRLIDQFDWNGVPVYARLKSPRGKGTLALHMVEPGQKFPETGGVRLYFEIQALEKFCARLEAAGVKLKQAPKLMPWGWKHAYLDDPDGHEVSLYWAGAKRFRKTRMAG